VTTTPETRGPAHATNADRPETTTTHHGSQGYRTAEYGFPQGRWMSDLADRGVLTMADALGADVRHGRIVECPACHATTRSKTDRRLGAVYTCHGGKGWGCSHCGAKGDAITYARLRLDVGADSRRLREALEAAGVLDEGDRPARPVEPPKPASPPPRPSGVAEEWARSGPVTSDPIAVAYLRRRGIDPDMVADRDLARVPPDLGHVVGYRLVLPAWGASGALESRRERWVLDDPPPPRGVKSRAPAGGPGSATSLILADGLGRQILELGTRPEWWPADRPLRVVVVEGEPDFLTVATAYGDADECAPAVFGVWSGGWTSAIGARIPDGAEVVIATHNDDTGDRYARTIAESLAGRCRVVRRQAGGAA
jgi:hypothetical protein